MPASRTTTLGFAQRARKNLVSVKKAFDSKEDIHWKDVHVVTQLVNSLLGIVVVPRERDREKLRLSKTLKELYDNGWPRWNIPCDIRDTCNTCEKCQETATLDDLIWHLRNAAAHGHFEFVGDPESRYLERVRLVVSSIPFATPGDPVHSVDNLLRPSRIIPSPRSPLETGACCTAPRMACRSFTTCPPIRVRSET